jgi:hypothetical protein
LHVTGTVDVELVAMALFSSFNVAPGDIRCPTVDVGSVAGFDHSTMIALAFTGPTVQRMFCWSGRVLYVVTVIGTVLSVVTTSISVPA